MKEWTLAYMMLAPWAAAAQLASGTAAREQHAPPTPPPIITNSVAAPAFRGPLAGTIYSIGNPTDEEQLYLEYLNRARANPPAEGNIFANTTDPDVLDSYTFFNVNLALMQAQFNAILPAQPLSMSAKLMAAARLHSGDMFTNNFQGHVGSNGSTLGTRATTQGYNYSTLGENVYSYASSVFYGHAGFDVDWGPGSGGMQTPPGHRNNIHTNAFREVGVGVVDGTNGNVGPQLVTHDFGTQQGATPFVTGVAYYDINPNSFFDPGEGLGGVDVQVAGVNFYAVTTNSGGYSVPVPGNGTYTVTFSGSGLPTTQRTVTVSGGNNVKVDFRPAYAPPQLSGPDSVPVGAASPYTFTPVGGAIGYLWRQTRLVPFTDIEGAENGLSTNVTAVTSPGYPVIANDIKASGSASFHLAHPDPGEDQFLILNRALRANPSSQLTFSSRLTAATVNEIASVEISTDDGVTWNVVWSQAGSGGTGQSTFSGQGISLAAFAGQGIRVRFSFAVTGSYFPYPQQVPTGWYIDNIAFNNVDEVTAPVVSNVANTNFLFSPTQSGTYLLEAAAQLYGHVLNYGPAKTVIATLQPVVRINSIDMVLPNQARIDFQVLSGSPAGFQIETADEVNGVWSVDSTATVQTVIPGSRYTALTAPALGTLHFYRVRVLP